MQVLEKIVAFLGDNISLVLTVVIFLVGIFMTVRFRGGQVRHLGQGMKNLFKEEEGVGMLEYINTKRLDKSCELLKLSSKTVTEVARQTGFNNVTYFNRLFKKRFGKTPTEYRNKKYK